MPNTDATSSNSSTDPEGNEGSSSGESMTPDQIIEAYRRRQSGADAARKAAEERAKAAEARLAEIEAKNRTAEESQIADAAGWKARAEEWQRKAEQAARDADARILDAKYPNARKELPEVTDEVRLAKFEAMLREDAPVVPPDPIGTNPARTASQSSAPAKKQTGDDILAQLKTMKNPWFENNPFRQ